MGSEILDVTDVTILRERVVRLTFENGEVRDIDLAPFLWGPAFADLDDDATFRSLMVDPDAGTVVWPNGADLSAHTLYEHSHPANTRQAG